MQAIDKVNVSDSIAKWRNGGMSAIINMCVGMFGIQIVWALHNGNTSRIFQTLGANVEQLPILWIAAPISGLLVQPIIGFLSDRTRSRWGRRRPYMVAGALCSALALFAMPNAPTLWLASLALWLLIASVNVAMEPFRALVADTLPEEQRATGFAMQVFFIGSGAVFASIMPWVLTHWVDISGHAEPGTLPASVRISYYIGGSCMLAAVGWTVLTTPEKPLFPHEEKAVVQPSAAFMANSSRSLGRHGLAWTLVGIIVALAAAIAGFQREIYIIAAVCCLFGLMLLAAARYRREGLALAGPLQIVEDIMQMPIILRRLAVVQFFTWFALFAMWIYAVPNVASYQFSSAGSDAGYQASADWVGVIFAGYNGAAALVALGLPWMVRRFGSRSTHAVSLLIGSAGLLSFTAFQEPTMLWFSAIAIGCAWASILSLPYAILANAVPPEKIGVYMGIHNIFVVLPQLVAATLLGPLIAHSFDGQAQYALVLGAGSMLLAVAATLALPPNN